MTGTNAWVFKKADGALGFLLTVVTAPAGLPEMKHLKLSYKPEKLLHLRGRQFTLRRCLEVEADSECDPETFGRILERLHDETPSGEYTTQLVVETIRDVMAIVQRAPDEVSFEEALGTWGELHILLTLLLRAKDPAVQRRIISAWESEGKTRDIIDFRFPWAGVALEVKSSIDKRIHHFHGHGQATVPSSYSAGYVASVLVEKDSKGHTCSRLLAAIRAAAVGTKDERQAFGEELDRKVALRGRACLDDEFRFAAENEAFALIPMEAVPRPSVEPNVTDVEWTADLSTCPILAAADVDGVVSSVVH